MSYFAIIENGIVVNVIKADLVYVQKLGVTYKETFKTTEGVKMAGKGYEYNSSLDVFVSPKPYTDWTFDNTTKDWKAPTPYPTDGKEYTWSSKTNSWVLVSSLNTSKTDTGSTPDEIKK